MLTRDQQSTDYRISHIQYSTEKQRDSHSSTIGFATPVPHCNFNLIQYDSMDRPERKTFPKGRNSSPLGIAAPHNRLAYRTIQQKSIPKGRKNLPFRSRPPFRNIPKGRKNLPFRSIHHTILYRDAEGLTQFDY